MIAMSFMRMLRAGPDVSFKGSPTVSPTTAALWMSLPLPPKLGSTLLSMYFLALSQAPPVLDMEIANWTPLSKEPVRRPKTPNYEDSDY